MEELKEKGLIAILMGLVILLLFSVWVIYYLAMEVQESNAWVRNLDQTVNVIPTEVTCKVDAVTDCNCLWDVVVENPEKK